MKASSHCSSSRRRKASATSTRTAVTKRERSIVDRTGAAGASGGPMVAFRPMPAGRETLRVGLAALAAAVVLTAPIYAHRDHWGIFDWDPKLMEEGQARAAL